VAALTDTEKAKVRRYLGFANWQSTALAWGIAFPTAIQPVWYINDAIERLSDEGMELVRSDLMQLEDTERQMREARKRLSASKIGDITLNADELPSLRAELENWKRQLADDFGAELNIYRQSDGGGTRNGKVVG